MDLIKKKKLGSLKTYFKHQSPDINIIIAIFMTIIWCTFNTFKNCFKYVKVCLLAKMLINILSFKLLVVELMGNTLYIRVDILNRSSFYQSINSSIHQSSLFSLYIFNYIHLFGLFLDWSNAHSFICLSIYINLLIYEWTFI